jgi:hypothetical protein
MDYSSTSYVILEVCRIVDDDVSFAPSLLAVSMEHYLKRCAGSRAIVHNTLVGYNGLAQNIDTGQALLL